MNLGNIYRLIPKVVDQERQMRRQAVNGIAGLTAAVAFAVSGCGGGGIDQDLRSLPASEGSSVNATNYVDVGQGAVLASLSSSSSIGSTNSSPESVSRFIKAQLPLLPGQAARAPASVGGVGASITTACAFGGSSTIIYNNVNNLAAFDAGDSITNIQSNCNDGVQRVSGTMKFTVIRASGDWISSYLYDYAFAVVLTNLTVTTVSGTTVSNGSITLAESSSSLNNFDASVVADNSATSTDGNGLPYSRDFVAFNAREKRTSSLGGTYSTEYTANGRLLSSGIGYRVSLTVTTVRPFVQSSVNSHPSSGQVLITTSEGATVRVTALDSDSLKIELDADGNGSPELSTTRLWSQLR